MAVEIKELIIRAVVDYKEPESFGESDTPLASQQSHTSEQQLIQACVKQVLKILKKQQQR